MPWAAILLIPWPYLLAQVSGGGDVTGIATLVGQIGLSGVFFWQWRTADKERQEKDAIILDFLTKFGSALDSATDTLERVQTSMAVQVDRVAGAIPNRNDSDLLMRRMELAVDELRLELTQTRRKKEEGGTL